MGESIQDSVIRFDDKKVRIELIDGTIKEGKLSGYRCHQGTARIKDLFLGLHEVVRVEDVKEIRLV